MEFERLLNKIIGVSESTLLSVFISDLKPHLRRELILRRPATLAVAFALARELSAMHTDIATVSSTMSTPPSTQQQLLSSAPPRPSAPAHDPLPPPQITTPPTRPELPICRLTFAEKQAKDAQGLCYNCDQKWSRSHRYASRLLLLIGDDDKVVEDIEPPPPEIDETALSADLSYLNSLSGVSHLLAFRLNGAIQNTTVHVLINGGSTHNFVHPNIIETLHLPINLVPPFRVYVGNGESLPCTT